MNNLKRILDLARKTGDKIIITDQNGEADFVLMPVSDYEKIIDGQNDVKDLSEEELWNKVDRDIALWKTEHSDEYADDSLMGSDDFEPEPMLPLVDPFDENTRTQEQGNAGTHDDLSGENYPWDIDDNDGSEFEDSDENDFEDEEDRWTKEEIEKATVGEALDFVKKQETRNKKQQEKNGKARFAIPKERMESNESAFAKATADKRQTEKINEQNIDEEFEKENESEGIKYEDIPPPPDVRVEDLIVNEPEKIIDTSFEEADANSRMDANDTNNFDDEEFDEDEMAF